MAVRRQKLSQRRKAVGLTQELLAEHLGVERSTVIRWEAGESQPLPSIRPNLARALHVSIDQLAELLTQSEDAGMVRPPSAVPEVTAPVPALEVPPQRAPGAPELDTLVHSQVAETVEALRRALRSAGVSAEDLAAMLLIGGSSQVSLGAPGVPPHIEALNLSAPTTVPLAVEAADVQRRRVSSRRCNRLAAVGLFVLAFPAAWLSAPFVISQDGSRPQASAGTPQSAVPVVAIPAPNPGSNSGRADTAAGTAPIATPAVVAVPVTQTARATRSSRTVSRSTRPAKTRPPEWVLPAAVAGERWGDLGQLEQIDHLW